MRWVPLWSQPKGGTRGRAHICGDGSLRGPGQKEDLPHPMGSLQGQTHTSGKLERKCILADTLFWISVGYLPIKKIVIGRYTFLSKCFMLNIQLENLLSCRALWYTVMLALSSPLKKSGQNAAKQWWQSKKIAHPVCMTNKNGSIMTWALISKFRAGEEEMLEQFWASNHYCAGRKLYKTTLLHNGRFHQDHTTSRGTLSCWARRWPHMRRALATGQDPAMRK